MPEQIDAELENRAQTASGAPPVYIKSGQVAHSMSTPPFGFSTSVPEFLHFGFGQVLYANEVIFPVTRTYQFVELGLDCRAIPILSVLDEEHHQESDDRCSGVDHELPCFREAEVRSGHSPEDDRRQTDGKGPRCAGGVGDRLRHAVEGFFQFSPLKICTRRSTIATGSRATCL